MPNYDVAFEEGLRRLQHLAYAYGVLAILRQSRGLEAALSEASWLEARVLGTVYGKGAPAIWTTYFATGYADALGRQTCRYIALAS